GDRPGWAIENRKLQIANARGQRTGDGGTRRQGAIGTGHFTAKKQGWPDMLSLSESFTVIHCLNTFCPIAGR
ncbi:MAG: hypothetical protein WCO26_25725, partial [Deltaproteobacteria bacterium]